MSLATYPEYYTCGGGRFLVRRRLVLGTNIYDGVRIADQRPLVITSVQPHRRDALVAAITYDVPGTTALLAVTQVDPGSWQPQPGDDLDEPGVDTEEDLPEGFVLVVETRPRGTSLRALGPGAAPRAVAIGAGLLRAVAAGVERGVFLEGIRPETVYAEGHAFAGCHARLWRVAMSPARPGEFGGGFEPGGFFAPEILWSDPPTPTSDAFAAAAVLWWFATGRDPFGGPDDFHQRTLDGRLEPFAGPPELGEILVPMLARDPAARPSASASADRLAALARRWDVPVAPFPPPGLDA
ncbi:MAG: hypothetical protein JNK64_19855 [Myxococcales bacterium]|nr:hypothetical protein [Myxococcales bacterium]